MSHRTLLAPLLAAPLMIFAAETAQAEANNCARAASPTFMRYFLTLPFRETPFADLVGLHPITKDQTGTRNHYRFDYDARGRPICVTFALGDGPRAPNHTANYFFTAPQVAIAYGGGEERRTFYDVHGNRIAINGGVAEEVFTLDDLGYRATLIFLDIDGQPVERDWGIARYDWRIEKDGTIIETRAGLGGGAMPPMRPSLPFHTLRLHYGPEGFLALMENYGVDGDRLTLNELNAAQDRLEYEADGDIRAWNVYDADGARARGNSPDVARGINMFDDNGYVIATRYEDETGAPIRSAYGWGVSRARYDSFGNMIWRKTSDERGAPAINELLGYAGYRMTYDATGRNRISLDYFDAADRPVVHARRGYARVAQDYDAHGNRTRIRYYGLDDALVDRTDLGVAEIGHRYDDRNRRIETRHFNAAGALAMRDGAGWAVERLRYVEGTAIVAARERYDADMAPIEED